jgi:hypothetical protein
MFSKILRYLAQFLKIKIQEECRKNERPRFSYPGKLTHTGATISCVTASLCPRAVATRLGQPRRCPMRWPLGGHGAAPTR